MLFTEFSFLIFFVVAFGVHWLLPWHGARKLWLLACSYGFYAGWDWRFLGLILASTVIDYFVGRRLEGERATSERRFLLTLSLGGNLGMLGVFKYYDFFVESAVAALASAGVEVSVESLGLILPVGISFYTFQTLAYTIDVYRGRLEPERSLVVFGLYVAWFPQLVAGPIERAGAMLPQFHAPRVVDERRIAEGAVLILIGLVRKVVIADNAARFADPVFASPGDYGAGGLALGALFFALQIYGDFSGYSDIARGTSKLFGIELRINFDQPYFSTSLAEFWRRWHISLGAWLRDYLYIPLGGSHGTRLVTARSLMLTMLLGGLWHGAAWTFVAWGALHGVGLAVHRAWSSSRRLPTLVGWALTMSVVGIGWILFRAPDFGTAWLFLTRMFSAAEGLGAPWQAAAALVLLVLAIDVPQARSRDHLVWLRWPWWLRGAVYAAAVLVLVVWPSPVRATFLYFQF